MPLKGSAAPLLTTPPPTPGVPVSTARSAWGNPESPSSWFRPFVFFLSWKITPVSRNDSAVVNLQHNVQCVLVGHIAKKQDLVNFFPSYTLILMIGAHASVFLLFFCFVFGFTVKLQLHTHTHTRLFFFPGRILISKHHF